MNPNQPKARLYIPDHAEEPEASSRISHLGIGAHQDDLEFMAFHGILECYHSAKDWFGGVTCTDGGGSARVGKYAKFSDDDMKAVRLEEQDQAAHVGRYGAMWQLAHPSSTIKDPANHDLAEEVTAILQASHPRVVYTHNLADKHDTHVAVTMAVIEALRALPRSSRPEKIYGCEVWRGLEWMLDDEKVPLDVSAHENLAMALNGIFDSQIAGGKRYDLAVLGRRRANATFFESHAADETDQIWFAMDMTPLLHDDSLDPVAFATAPIDRFRQDVEDRIKRFRPATGS